MPANEPPFLRLGRAKNCDPETAHTIVELIDCVGAQFADSEWYWEKFQDSIDEKCKPGYRAAFDAAKLDEAWALLCKQEWLSLQNVNARKEISTLVPLEGLTRLRSLILTGNAVQDIEPLARLSNLRKLILTSNRVQDLSPLSTCRKLEVLHIGENPAGDLGVLERLPALRELSISSDQLAVFVRCRAVPSLRKLRIDGDGNAVSFVHFPDLPNLRNLHLKGVSESEGLQRFTIIENLDLGGEGYSLQPLSNLHLLTHVTLWAKGGLDLGPLAEVNALRSIAVFCDRVTGISELERLPVLHELRLDAKHTKVDGKELDRLRAGLTPWDSEFLSERQQATPSLELEVVSQEQFDYYDKKVPYGIVLGDTNEGMLLSERDRLLSRMEASLGIDFSNGEAEDLTFPLRHSGGRSNTLCLYSMRAYQSFRQIAATVQEHLCKVKNPWIIYLQTDLLSGPDAGDVPEDAEEIIVWVYPDKFVTTSEHAETVQRLLKL